ncbi:MAG: hypothetical protein RMI34_12385 [Chloroherpetonaceae bacterium]|nr:hypothetical protein [Chloroherpetonaceae bacterium]MCS7211674.1 hypothetical protein [Chloroherpetonaceae bacterium]MDW8020855.1 hypothetical protein [Chloroherpetonaceae bacterium]MDW8466123.1 hypothetical protein [Chloroherpetonaceae bacterium]
MKLRIKGNSLRLRLSQSEVRRIAETGQVEDRIEFGTEASQAMRYVLKSDKDAQRIFATFDHCTITVTVPEAIAKTWALTEQVGVQAQQSVGEGKTLSILIEKDFQCLTARPNEDESDNYPHPMAAVGHQATIDACEGQ